MQLPTVSGAANFGQTVVGGVETSRNADGVRVNQEDSCLQLFRPSKMYVFISIQNTNTYKVPSHARALAGDIKCQIWVP